MFGWLVTITGYCFGYPAQTAEFCAFMTCSIPGALLGACCADFNSFRNL